jgi:hypothetical protein
MYITLSDIKSEVDRLARLIGAPEGYLPTYGHTEDGARPHIEVDPSGYHYVVVERGQELERITTTDIDELLSTIFASVTFSLACDYELRHRKANQDSRRLMFRRQIDLLSILSPEWAVREGERHEEILLRHPFDDASDKRVGH